MVARVTNHLIFSLLLLLSYNLNIQKMWKRQISLRNVTEEKAYERCMKAFNVGPIVQINVHGFFILWSISWGYNDKIAQILRNRGSKTIENKPTEIFSINVMFLI